MGWSSGSELMSRVIDSMVLAQISAPQRTSAYRGIIAAFQDADCDTLDECSGMDPAFDAAFTDSSEKDSAPVEPDSEQYVVELRSDDNEPLTMEWLDTVRPAISENSYAWQIATAKVFFDVRFFYQTCTYCVCICDDTFRWQRLFDIKTRGEVRRICRALKAVVPL